MQPKKEKSAFEFRFGPIHIYASGGGALIAATTLAALTLVLALH